MAFSEGPTRRPTINQPFTIPAGSACTFPLHGEPVINQEVTKTFPPEPNGDVKQIVTGRLVFELTNLDTHKSMTVNISGPVFAIFHPDGSITGDLGGISLNLFGPTDIPPATAFINSGRVVINVTSSGQLILVSQSGHEEDVCAALS
jgi:hypothetical protein